MSKRRGRRKRNSRKKLAYGVIAVAFIIICFLTYFSLHQSNQTHDNQTSQPKAAIVDHLSFRNETANQTFVDTSKNIVEEAGFAVDYYRGNEVNVTFYKYLPTHGYSLIVLRVHSALIRNTTSLGLFTSELYSNSTYIEEQADGRLVIAYFPEGGPKYFGIAPKFVEKSMEEKLQNTIIILMGCDGLKYNTMAEAFRGKGAKVCIGWNGLVSTSHTDHATTFLLQRLAQGNTVEKAIENTMKEVGPDETYNSTLEYYPGTAGNCTIQYTISISIDRMGWNQLKIDPALKLVVLSMQSKNSLSMITYRRIFVGLISVLCTNRRF